jgi:hypothetical protein
VRAVNDPDEREPEDARPVLPDILAGGAVAVAGVRLGPEAAIVLGMGGRLFESLAQHVWEELRPDARRRTGQMLATAAEAAGCDAERLHGLIGASERNRLMAGMAMQAAERTEWPPQVRTVGKVLAAGLIASDDAVDVPQFALTAMEDLGRLHVSLLDLLVWYEPAWEGNTRAFRRLPAATDAGERAWTVGRRIWTAQFILTARPGLRPVFTSVAGTLVRHGLAEQTDRALEAMEQLSKEFEQQINQQAAAARRGGGTGMFTPVQAPAIHGIERSWSPTELGEQVLGFYLEAGAEAEIADLAAPQADR